MSGRTRRQAQGRLFVAGSRGSRLALRQTDIVLAALRSRNPGARFEVRTIHTAGDRSRASLSEIGGRGVFVIELERALLAGDIDIAVHSLKDLPSQETPGVVIAAVARREDPRDALVSRDGLRLSELPAGAVVGTGSPRRAAQLRAHRPDIRVADIRGNVDTRIRKVQDGEYDAVVLAAAGLARLGWLDRAAEILPPEVMLPAVGQGALAVQVRSDDGEAAELVRAADDGHARAAVTAERAFERRLGGGCQAATAAYAVVLSGDNAAGVSAPDRGDPPRLHLRGLVADPTGERLIRGEIKGPAADAEVLGARLAEQLIEQGAAALIETTS
ncbi:MAG: hydroxymethylbilane synthase [Chloroflexi bacterium]|nr:hydroxymethylbilane synthase [Chloroflexota bacterium]